MCRDYVLGPGRSLLADSLGEVGSGIVADPAARKQIQIDVAVVEAGTGAHKPKVAMLGEVKWGTVMGLKHLERLSRARDLLAGRGADTTGCELVCFSAPLVAEAARSGSVLLVGLEQLYGRGGERAALLE
jgi:hypothetical protein